MPHQNEIRPLGATGLGNCHRRLASENPRYPTKSAPGQAENTADARSVRFESEIARRGIKLTAGPAERCGPCPVCGGRDRFSINLKKQLWNCRGCATGGDIIALVRHLDGISFGEAVRMLTGHQPSGEPPLGGHGRHARFKDSGAPAKVATQPAWALKIWRQAVDPRGTLIEGYLRSRRLELPREAANEAIRYHSACPFGLERFPAMVCLVRSIVSNEPQAIHRTALAPDRAAIKRDGKTFRLSLGPIAGGAIKIDPDEDVTQGICIGEGVETCLAGRQMGLRPVWSAVSKGGVASFPVLPGIDGLHIFRENDTNGVSVEAVETCARRWYEAGRDVVVVDPDFGNDLNDELREAAR